MNNRYYYKIFSIFLPFNGNLILCFAVSYCIIIYKITHDQLMEKDGTSMLVPSCFKVKPECSMCFLWENIKTFVFTVHNKETKQKTNYNKLYTSVVKGLVANRCANHEKLSIIKNLRARAN